MSDHVGGQHPGTEVLSALLDTLLPPRPDTPGGGDPVFVDRVLADAADGPLAAALRVVVDQLGEGFVERPRAARETAFRDVEAQDPEAAAAVVNLAYTAYYTDRRVLETLERTVDYRAVPPQPRGHDLPDTPLDSILPLGHEPLPLWRSR